MSRIGKQPVKIPDGVKADLDGNTLRVEGPLGKLQQSFRPEITVTIDEQQKLIRVARDSDARTSRALHGLSRALVQNMVTGVTTGFEKRLEIVGVGYLGIVQEGRLELRVGFHNEVHRKIPAGLTVTCPDQNHVVVKGVDKQAVGQFAAEVRAIRKPEPYKGKGIRYEGEVVHRKPGKAMTK